VSRSGGFHGRAARLLDAPTATRAEILALVADRLADVEALFRESLGSPLRIIEEIGDFLAEGGGKRVRPTLHLLSARLCGYEGRKDVLLATVLEFIHSATLIHDDIIDEAKTRRGRPSVNRVWGNSVTVLFGDYLYAKAMEMALRAESLDVMEKLADVTLRMTEGEMLQTRYAGRIDLGEDEYFDLIERKTAELFAACCELAGTLADVDDGRREALRRYGLNLGLAFQVVDDLLDFVGDAKTLGKPAASDLREGKVTLPLIELLASGPSRARELAVAIMESGEADTPEITELALLLERSGAIDRAHHRAREYASRATLALEIFPDSPARTALQAVPDLLHYRDR
jgi:octaprenyl-diphosphate synthase